MCNMNINNLENKCLKPIIYSVYGNCVSGDALQDLLSNMVAYINKCIDSVNTTTDLVNKLYDYVVNEGLSNEVIKEINKMIDNGTFETIINQELFGDLSDSLNANKTQIEQLNVKLNNEIQDRKSEGEVIKQLITEESNNRIQGDTRLEGLITQEGVNRNEAITTLDNKLKTITMELYSGFELKAIKKYAIEPNMLGTGLQKFVDEVNSLTDTSSMIYIPRGNYTFDKTVENLNNVHIIFDKNCVLSVGESCKMGAFTNGTIDKFDYTSGRSAGSNITIDNATFITSGYTFGFAIGENIKISNFKSNFKSGGHCCEIAGVKNFTIDKAVFISDGRSDNYRDEAEAIQIQTTTTSAFPFFGNNENIPCKDITFKRVTIEGASTGIGGHGAVYKIWEEDFIFEKCCFKNCTTGIRLWGYRNVIIQDSTFIDNQKDIYCTGLIRNDDLQRPTGMACQNLFLSNLLFSDNRGDKDACLSIINKKRNKNDRGDNMTYGVTCNNLVFKSKGYGVRLHNCISVALNNLTGYVGKGFTISNTEMFSIGNSNIENTSDFPVIDFKHESDYYSDGICRYVNIKSCNFKTINKGIIVTQVFEGNIQNNFIQLTGSDTNKLAIMLDNGASQFYVSNNSDYCHNTQSGVLYKATPQSSSVFFDSNLSKGKKGSSTIENNSGGTKGTFTPSYS